MKNLANSVVDTINDGIEKVSSPSSRAGSTVERVGRLLEHGVSPSVIALQLTENSQKNNAYTASDVMALGKVYDDAKTKAVITAKQTRSLIDDQREHNYSSQCSA